VKNLHTSTLSSKKILPVFWLVLCVFLNLNPVYAEQSQKSKLLETLDEIKNKQADLLGKSQDFHNQTSSLLLDLDQNRALIENNKIEVTKLLDAIAGAEEEIHAKKVKQGEILAALYIEQSGNKRFFALLSAGSLSELVERQVYIKTTQDQLIDHIKGIQEEAGKLAEAKQAALVQREILAAQIDILQNQIGSLKSAITETESKIKDLEKTGKDVEKQIINLDVPSVSKSTREFTTWDSVDFTTQQSMIIYGAGTPHGLGMSQYGAKAMADSGRDYEEILTHYYQGTHLDTINTSDTAIKVKLSASANGGKVIVTNGPAQKVINGAVEEVPAGTIIDTQPGLVVRSLSPDTRLVITYKFDRFNSYRGNISIVGSPGGYATINTLPLEDYLRSVISGEMSASWTKEALKAQAVAARNYAIKNRGSHSEYDLCDTPACQVYLGASHEFASTDAAVAETNGKVLKYNNDLITAYYFSSSGGWTENNENVWGGKPIPWLRGVESPGEQSPYNSWQTISLDRTTLQRYLNSDEDTSVGELQKIEIIKRGVSGIVMAIKVTGSTGEKTVTGQTFKYVINVNIPDGTKDYIKSGLFGIK